MVDSPSNPKPRTIAKPTEVQLRVLRDIFNKGALFVSAFSGRHKYTGKIYGIESKCPGITFRSLRNKGWIRQLGRDCVKELWDISSPGVDTLATYELAYSDIHPKLVERRLQASKEVWAYDTLGFLTRKGRSKRGMSPSIRDIESLAVLAEERLSELGGSFESVEVRGSLEGLIEVGRGDFGKVGRDGVPGVLWRLRLMPNSRIS